MNAFRRYVLGILLCWLPGWGQAQQPHASMDILHYVFEVKLSTQSSRINGQATLHLRALQALDRLSLDLVASRPDGQGMKVSRIQLAGRALSYRQLDEQLLIDVPHQTAGDTLSLRITYAGQPADGLIIAQNKYGEPTFFADHWPNRAHHWLPTVDHPADKASCEFIVTAPSTYRVVANGLKQAETQLSNGDTRTHWKTDRPLPTKVMVIGVAKFAVQELPTLAGIPIQSWVFPQNREAGFKDYAPGREILAFFEQKLGDYPYLKLANVQSKTRYGGMENAGTIFYAEHSVTGSNALHRLLAHEIAHQWFGNSASEIDWPHIWLSEGFATYLSYVYLEEARAAGSLPRQLQNDKARIRAYHRLYPQARMVDSSYADLNQYLNAYSYQKGAWVLHMLRQQVGESAFWQGIRTYHDRHRHGNASTEDFQAAMEQASHQDLSIFFEQWCYRSSLPELEVRWAYESEAGEVMLEIRQLQPGQAFQLPLELEVGFGKTLPPLRHKVSLNQRRTRLRLAVKQAPVRITVDPSQQLLLEARVVP